MAIYHLNVSTGSKAKGQSAKAKADYIEREGKYAKGKEEVLHVESGNMPEWAQADPTHYWQMADEYERDNGRLFTQVEFALPIELSTDEKIALCHDFANHLTQGQNLPYTLAIHKGEFDHRGRKTDTPENPHCHLIISERINDNIERDPDRWFRRANKKDPSKGGALKSEILKTRDWLCETREQWQTFANRALERAGHHERIDHRTLEAQGITDRLPQIHRGATEPMHRRGIKTERYSRSVLIAETNASLRAMSHDKALAEMEQERASKRIEEVKNAQQREEIETVLREIQRDFKALSPLQLRAQYEHYVKQRNETAGELSNHSINEKKLTDELEKATQKAKASYNTYHHYKGKLFSKWRFSKEIAQAFAENKQHAKTIEDTQKRLDSLVAPETLKQRLIHIDAVLRLAGDALSQKEAQARDERLRELPSEERALWKKVERQLSNEISRRPHDEISYQRYINGHFKSFMLSFDNRQRQQNKAPKNAPYRANARDKDLER